jgi:hypothetical protein
MALFRRQLVIESLLPPQEAWRNLLTVVKTNQTQCAACGQPLAGATHFCSHCGQPVAPPLPRTAQPQFEGYISPREFNITRIINYRNSRIPVIRGRFEPSPTGTKIVIEMTMHPFGYVFPIGGATLAFFVVSTLASDSQGFPVTAIAALAAPCVIALVCWIAFTSEANTARTALSQLWPPAAQV